LARETDQKRIDRCLDVAGVPVERCKELSLKQDYAWGARLPCHDNMEGIAVGKGVPQRMTPTMGGGLERIGARH
jgi:hypothetical protein